MAGLSENEIDSQMDAINEEYIEKFGDGTDTDNVQNDFADFDNDTDDADFQPAKKPVKPKAVRRQPKRKVEHLWLHEEILCLISEVEKRGELYDSGSKECKLSRNDAWDDVSNISNFSALSILTSFVRFTCRLLLRLTSVVLLWTRRKPNG